MKIHEFQARQILSDAGIPVPPAEVVRSPEEAAEAFRKFNQKMCVVKAQVYAGGRGKAGFVKLVKSADEARKAAEFMLSHKMTSYQTGPEGVPVSVLIVAPGVDIAKEYYLGITLDRGRGTATMIASAEGGVEIEEVAKNSPEKVLKEPLHPMLGLQGFQARDLAYQLGFRDKQAGEVAKLMTNLAKAFLKTDASLAEINPLVVTKEGQLLAIDAKFNFDDNALFRHKDLAAMADESRNARWTCGPKRPTSTTSPWTARSAVWSMGPAWPWRRWTSSSCTAPSRPTSSTSAGRSRRKGRSRRSRSSSPTPT